MKRQAVNPFLPSWEYIPDGEPRRFGDRVYLYGSHDRFGGLMTDSEAEDPIRSKTAVFYLYRKRKTGFPVFYNRIEHSG